MPPEEENTRGVKLPLSTSRTNHFMTNHLFADEQHGFLPSRSCTTQFLVAIEKWSEALDQGLPVDVIYLDFKKAFDSMPHQRLLIKLKVYGISGSLFA